MGDEQGDEVSPLVGTGAWVIFGFMPTLPSADGAMLAVLAGWDGLDG
jgi:hypothetical protein